MSWHRPECVMPDEVGAKGSCCCCGPANHEWQTGVAGVMPDVCMACGALRPHGDGIVIEVVEERDPILTPTDSAVIEGWLKEHA